MVKVLSISIWLIVPFGAEFYIENIFAWKVWTQDCIFSAFQWYYSETDVSCLFPHRVSIFFSNAIKILFYFFKKNHFYFTYQSSSISLPSLYSPHLPLTPSPIYTTKRVSPPLGSQQNVTSYWGRSKALFPVSRLNKVFLHRAWAPKSQLMR